ncbi:CCR4-NOT transcription complex subunit 4 [Orchesella cincta]|uniref:CCR4-NOT transcription complex subunit 4 n=1 Tax=Orchesella cincta TaxID=48709 RepID=A0A1D2MNQ8_ORCCI|nr:CCR4-NOT transcription complex subunit 4 [Orchesella cincta]
MNGNGHHHNHVHSSSSSSSQCTLPSSSTSSCNSIDDENVICPLCMENLDIDDKSFFPCTCGYQICRFCWHRIRSESDDQNGSCPACRKAYSENPATFKPLSSEDIQKIKLQKRQKDQQKKQKSESGKRHLADLRVVQKNLVFVVGISPRIADSDVLKKNEFFGKFGKIHKVVVNPCLQGTTASAYITYVKAEDALRAIQSVNNIPFDGKTIKVSLGTTKYCSHFMRNQTCPKTECMYLHHYGDPDASFTKEDMQAGKHQEYEKKLLEEFNNNNNNDGFKETKSNTVTAAKRITQVSAIQQGVSYSTKLLVNSGGSPPSSSSPPADCSTSDHMSEAAKMLEQATISEDDEPHEEDEEDDEEEEEEAPEPLAQQITPEQQTQEHMSELLEETDEDDLKNEDDVLDFDPFHETQKAFEEIINEQVAGESASQNSLLSRFIKRDAEQPSYLLGFQSSSSQVMSPQNYARVPQQQHVPPASSSLLLEFFNSYAYKQSPASIPPPPGFQQNEQKRLNGTNVWSNDVETPGSADWMSLDPAIIFSKTSSERNNAEQQRNLRLGLEHHAPFERNLFTQVPQNTLINHQLLRPTPTTTQYGNSMFQPPQQAPPLPQQYYRNGYFAGQPAASQAQQAAFESRARYFASGVGPQAQQSQQPAVVTPPPPGFGGLINNNFKSSNMVPQMHHQIHANGVTPNTSANFFPF